MFRVLAIFVRDLEVQKVKHEWYLRMAKKAKSLLFFEYVPVVRYKRYPSHLVELVEIYNFAVET